MSQELITHQSCKSCNTEYSGIFCPSCGQKLITKRFTVRDGVSNLFGVVLNFDRGLWPTLIGLITKPGKVIRDYLSGITIPYYHPFRFIFLMLSISVILMTFTGIYDYIQGDFSESFTGQRIPETTQILIGVMNSYMNILISLSVPILAFGSWLFFRKQGYNYAEHLIITSYAYGLTVFLGVIFIPIYYISKNLYVALSSLSLLISISFFIYVYISLFKGNVVLTILKAIGAFIVWMIGFTALMLVLFMAYADYRASVDPEFKELIIKERSSR